MSATYAEQIRIACDQLGKPFKSFTLLPFSRTLPMRKKMEGPFVLMGSTTVNRIAAKSRKFRPGTFYNPNTFRPDCYAQAYGPHYLNNDQRIVRIRDVKRDDYPLDEELFIRSNDDSKQIAGGTLKFSELLEIQSNTLGDHTVYTMDLFAPQSRICIASPKEIDCEFRMVIVNGQVITGCQYLPQIERESFVPQWVWLFASQMVQRWIPHPVCVMDVCWSGGRPKVLECNSFNGSGFYSANIPRIVSKVSDYMEALH